MGAAGLPLLLLFAASPIDRAATDLVTKLELESVPGFDLKSDLAIAIRPGSASNTRLVRALGGLLEARLEAKGATHVFLIDDAEDLEAGARDAGAEWLLLVTAETIDSEVLRLWAELRAVDRGLWVPVPKPGLSTIYATAETSARIEPALKEMLAVQEQKREEVHPEPQDSLRFAGAPARLFSIDDRVLAMAACDMPLRPTGPWAGKALPPRGDGDPNPSPPTVLAVLGTRALTLFGADKRKLGAFDLATLPRAAEPSREPIGTITCTKGEIAFGTGTLKTGHVARVEFGRSGEATLRIVRTVDGLPIGWLPGSRLVVGALDGGRSRFLGSLKVENAAKITAKDVGAPLLDVALDPAAPLGFRAIAVTIDHRLVRLSDELEGLVPVVSSGVGVRILADDKAALFVVTSNDLEEEHDRVVLVAVDHGGPRKIDAADVDGAVYATAVGSLWGEGRSLIVAAYRAPAGKTDLYSLKLTR